VTGIHKSNKGNLLGIYTEESTDSYAFHEVKANGTTAAVGESHSSANGETEFDFTRGVPDGSYLVVNTQDAAHNESSTLLIVNNTNAPVVDLNRAGLASFDLSAIDLTVAPEAHLSISESQLRAITGPDHSLIVKGGADDTVSLIGGLDTGTTKLVNGQSYSLYTLGSGASVLVDDDILTTTSVV
jgi:large repetitive protein